jgi:hypothetical protein
LVSNGSAAAISSRPAVMSFDLRQEPVTAGQPPPRRVLHLREARLNRATPLHRHDRVITGS